MLGRRLVRKIEESKDEDHRCGASRLALDAKSNESGEAGDARKDRHIR